MNRRSWTHNYNGITFTIVQAKLVTGSDTEEEARNVVINTKYLIAILYLTHHVKVCD